MGNFLQFQDRHDFSVVEQVFSPTRKLLVAPKVCEPLLHSQGYHAGWIIVVLHKHNSWVGLLVVSLLWMLVWCLLVLWKLIIKDEAFRLVLSHRPLDPAYEVHGVFSNRDFPSTSELCILV